MARRNYLTAWLLAWGVMLGGCGTPRMDRPFQTGQHARSFQRESAGKTVGADYLLYLPEAYGRERGPCSGVLLSELWTPTSGRWPRFPPPPPPRAPAGARAVVTSVDTSYAGTGGARGLIRFLKKYDGTEVCSRTPPPAPPLHPSDTPRGGQAQVHARWQQPRPFFRATEGRE